jgi:predicted nuclease of predicted toxin-antitoxin system
MKIILDECLPRRLIRDLHSYSVTTVPRQGWAGTTNGELLAKVEGEFDIFITLDSNIAFQQNLENLKLCVIVIRAVNSRYETLQPLIPDIVQAVDRAKVGNIVVIGKGARA